MPAAEYLAWFRKFRLVRTLMSVKSYGYHRYHEHSDENTVSSSRPPLRTAQQSLQTISGGDRVK